MVLDKPLTGYEIKKHIESGIGYFTKASYGSLYPLLKKSTDKGYLEMSEQSQGNRQKKYYQATKTGKDVFFEWLASPINFDDGVNNHLVKVFFFDRLPPEIRDRQLKEYEVRNINYLVGLQTLEKHLSQTENENNYFKHSTLYYGIRITEENIRWCRHLTERKPLPELLEARADT